MGKEINAILSAQTILIWTFVGQVHFLLLCVRASIKFGYFHPQIGLVFLYFIITFENVDIFLLK